MTEKQPIKESVEASAAKLTELCAEDVDEMKDKVADLDRIWNEMNEEKSSKDTDLEKLLNDLSEYEKLANAVEEKVKKVEKTLPTEAVVVLDLPRMRTNLSNVKSVREELAASRPQLDNTVAYGKELIDGDPDIDGSNVKRRNEELEKMFENVNEKAEDDVSKMEGLVQQIEQYVNSSKELKKDLDYVHEEVETNKPGLLDPESLRQKEAAVKVRDLRTVLYCTVLQTICLDSTLFGLQKNLFETGFSRAFLLWSF